MVIDLVCAGETFEDVIFHDLSQWPRLGEEFKTDRLLRTWGGGALLTAVAAARQGRPTQVVSALAAGAHKFLRREGIRVSNLRRGDEPHAFTVALSTRDDRAFVTYPGVNEQLEERLLRSLGRLKARHVHLALEPRDCEAWVKAVENLRSRGLTTSWDFGWNSALLERPGFAALTGAVDYLLLNEKEAMFYSGSSSWEEACGFWSDRTRCVVIKLGCRGCLAMAGQQSWTSPPVCVESVESTGAGDAFNGGFLAGLLEGLGMEGALELGNRVGAASTLQAGGLAGLPYRGGPRPQGASFRESQQTVSSLEETQRLA